MVDDFGSDIVLDVEERCRVVEDVSELDAGAALLEPPLSLLLPPPPLFPEISSATPGLIQLLIDAQLTLSEIHVCLHTILRSRVHNHDHPLPTLRTRKDVDGVLSGYSNWEITTWTRLDARIESTFRITWICQSRGGFRRALIVACEYEGHGITDGGADGIRMEGIIRSDGDLMVCCEAKSDEPQDDGQFEKRGPHHFVTAPARRCE